MAVDFRKFKLFGVHYAVKKLTSKHKSKIFNVIKMFSGSWEIPYKTKLGKKRCYFAKCSEYRKAKTQQIKISNFALLKGADINSIEKRLKGKVCELCGTVEAKHYEIHHINK